VVVWWVMTNTNQTRDDQGAVEARRALGSDYEIALACLRSGYIEGYIEICKRRRFVSEEPGR
jgi:hypothetical protein